MKRIVYIFTIAMFFCVCNAFSQQQLTNLPTLYIQTENNAPIADKENYVNASIVIKSLDPSEELSMQMGIRGRGNSTWGMPKKPYRIKLDSKTSLLNLSAREKNWVLLANYADKSLIRNALAFKISEIAGLKFSPSVRFIDVVLNNVYEGSYMLTDQVEVAAQRVPVESLKPEDTALPKLSGGYLLEIDGFASSEPVWFRTDKGLLITVKYPKDDEINPEQKNYIVNFTKQFENTLFSSNFTNPETGYRAYVDTASLVNWYIACELTGNSDAFWSTYIYKYRNIDKFYFGPLWDFDIAFNNDDRLGDAATKLMRNVAHEPKTWIKQIWADDWFKQAVHRRWMELINNENMLERLLDYINETSRMLEESQTLNFQKWNIMNQKVYREQFLFPSYQENVDYLAEYLIHRVNFLTESFENALPEEPSQPFVAEDFYYSITNKRTNNRIIVENKSTSLDASLCLWAPIDEDWSQLWLFQPTGNDAYQIINRQSELAMKGNGRNTNLIQVTPNALDTRQLWKIMPVNTGNIYGIVNVSTNYSVNNSGGNSANGTPAIEYDNRIAESENQQWYIQKMEKRSLETGINGFVNPKFKVYPNPASDWVHFQIPVKTGASVIAELYGINGKCLYKNLFTAGNEIQTIPLTPFLPGLYFLRIQTEGNLFVEKLVIR
jgi:hypothetical protein